MLELLHLVVQAEDIIVDTDHVDLDELLELTQGAKHRLIGPILSPEGAVL